METLPQLLSRIHQCQICAQHLAHEPRPVLQADHRARILIVGQAPGRKVHDTGIPFNDPSGVRLREWMGIDAGTFYDPRLIALLPMGFCYPGTGKSGDLPPRPECAAHWRAPLLDALPNVQLTLVVGSYAIGYHLPQYAKRGVAETVSAWREFWPAMIPLPHPSPRNNLWLRKYPWFEKEVVPALQQAVAEISKNVLP